MIRLKFKAPSKRDLTKSITDAAEKQIREKARLAAAPHGGVQVRFVHGADGALASVQFEGTDSAVQAARNALGS